MEDGAYDKLLPGSRTDGNTRASEISSATLISGNTEQDINRRSRSKERWVSLWTLEALAALFSIACIGGMIAVLVTIDGEIYEPWKMFSVDITPNSLLSILSTLSKSSVLLVVAEGLGQSKWAYFRQGSHRLIDLQLFDEATRGPLGSIKLLWSIKARSIFASAAAAIIVLSIAIDPFTQQILSFPTTLMRLDNVTAQIGSAYSFGAGDGTDFKQGSTVLQHWTEMNEAMLLGIMSGNNPTQFKCSTGNCHWAPFTTLGICNRCIDVSDQVGITCENQSSLAVKKKCNYKFPRISPNHKSFQTMVTWQTYYHNQSSFPQNSGPDMRIYVSPSPVMNNSVVQIYSSIASSEIAIVESLQFLDGSYYEGSYETNISTWRAWQISAPSPLAWQCNLTWCQQMHAATTCTAGKLLDLPTSTTGLAGGRSVSKKVEFLALWPVGQPPSPPLPEFVDDWKNHTEGIYWIDFLESVNLAESIKKIFGTGMQNTWHGGLLQKNQDLTPLQLRLFRGNLSQILDNVALSLTNKLRTLYRPRQMEGIEAQLVTVVRVEWYWLIYPTALALVGVVLLVFSIVTSNQDHVLVWKSSVLPLLLCAEDERTQDHKAVDGVTDLEQEAKRVEAILQPGPTLHIRNASKKDNNL